MGKGKNNSLVKVDAYLPIKQDAKELAALVEANMGDASQMRVFDLPRVQMPTGGGSKWTIPTLEGEDSVATVDGIVLCWQPVRGYWPGEFGGAMPPQCSSNDGLSGFGDPGGTCSVCPFAQFKSAARGGGQACKAMIRLLILRPDSMLPIVLSLPPTSLKAWRVYGAKLLNAQVPFWAAVTSIGLDQKQNPDSIKYSVATFAALKVLDEADRAGVQQYALRFREMLVASAIVTDDYVDGAYGEEL